jgi:hypothetical protein
MLKLNLFKDLCKNYPNSYVLVGEKYYPTRKELFDFEMFRLSQKANMYKYHEGLPIILTLEEHQQNIYERFEDFLIMGTKLTFDNMNQIDFILFLKSICSDKEIAHILHLCLPNPLLSSTILLFNLETWIELMNYEMQPLFLTEYHRLEICVAIHRGMYEFKEKWSFNVYGKQLSEINEHTLEKTNPLLHKALHFYHISFKHLREKYKYIDPYSNSCGAN